MQSDELGALGYVSSAPDILDSLLPDAPNPQDESDISTLLQVSKLIKERKHYYLNSINSLTLNDPVFTVEQQLEVNKKVAFHLQEIEGMIDNTVRKVREKINGRQ